MGVDLVRGDLVGVDLVRVDLVCSILRYVIFEYQNHHIYYKILCNLHPSVLQLTL